MKPDIPDPGFTYPADDPYAHILPIRKICDLIIDEKYPFLNKSFRFTVMRILIYIVIFVLVFPLTIFRYGLKIEGRKNLRKFRHELANGVMTISNHVHFWDFLFLLRSVRFRAMYFPAWKENLMGPDKDLIRYTGGIPIPEEIGLIKYFNKAFDEIIAKKIWIHSYPEVANWPYYRYVRPFKKGVFTMAYRYRLPVLPVAYRYAKPIWPLRIVNLFRKRKLPTVIARIGEPLFFDFEKPRKEAVRILRKQCHEAIIALAGIENNPWPAEGD